MGGIEKDCVLPRSLLLTVLGGNAEPRKLVPCRAVIRWGTGDMIGESPVSSILLPSFDDSTIGDMGLIILVLGADDLIAAVAAVVVTFFLGALFLIAREPLGLVEAEVLVSSSSFDLVDELQRICIHKRWLPR